MIQENARGECLGRCQSNTPNKQEGGGNPDLKGFELLVSALERLKAEVYGKP